MAKKKASISMRRNLWFIVFFSVLLFVLALLRINSHGSSSEILLSNPETPFVGIPKIAFLFLARAHLPLDFLWHCFFQNGEVGRFSIYVHSEPGFVFSKATSRSPFFHGRQINNSIQVAWGESSMIEAERLLLSAALEDPGNQRFVLLSDSCVPLYNFSYTYEYLLSSSKSFVDSFLDTKESRYTPKMYPTIPQEKWRKGSQWITLVRKHASVLVADDAIFPLFRKYCKRRPALDIKKMKNMKPVVQKEHNCIPDEHYVQTLLSISDLDDELERRTLTFTAWNVSSAKMDRQNWHPVTFEYANASPQHIKAIKGTNNVYYETEYRNEWCKSNETLVPCFLFARKFSQGAAMRLLSEGLVGPFDAATMLTALL
ncbi:Glycosyl transferase family 14 protein [Dioscorea alata]|uniref:Glycosyl transferase family 14 protein n=1 Tax=Dioscorea alata TaxID=55571 RepID=A0ACB7TT00_DIOAL|nr:Glycosyl transferase family 14 protein [Dioscorea alata]